MSMVDENVDIFNITAGKLRQALKAGDILEASAQWSILKQKNLIHFLGLPHMEGYSRLITSLSPVNNPDTKWDEQQEKAAEEIALGAATSGNATGALTTCMQFHLANGNADGALDLYNRYASLLVERKDNLEATVASTDGEQDRPDALGLSLPDKPIHYSPGRSTVLLTAIVAHAMKGSFPGALKTYLGTAVRIPQSALKGRLKSLPIDSALQRKVEEYVRRLDAARSVANPTALITHVNNLSGTHAVERIEKLYKAVLDGLSGPDAYLAPNLTDVTHEKPIHLTEASWGCFLTAFVRCRRNNLAERLWDDMVSHGVTPGVATWTALFAGYESLGKVNDTLAGWKTMLSQGVNPDTFAYRSLCSVLCTAERPDEALLYLKDFEDAVSKGTLSSDNSLHLYNTVIHGLLTNSRESDALALLQRIQKQGPTPNLVTHNTFLRYYGRRGDFKALGSILQRLASDGLVGDVFTFTTILSALLKAGREDAEEITFNLMKKQNVVPNAGFYSALIDYQVRQQDPKNLLSALNILKKMEHDPEVRANQVPYTSLLAGIYRVHWLDSKIADECKEYVLDRMDAGHVRPNRVTYHILLSAALANREPEGLQNALSLYREMTKRRIGMSNDTWYILLHGLIDRGEWALASEMAEDLKRMGDVVPVGATADLVVRIKKRMTQKMKLGPDGYF